MKKIFYLILAAVTMTLAACGDGNDPAAKKFQFTVTKVNNTTVDVEIKALNENKYFICSYGNSAGVLSNPEELAQGTVDVTKDIGNFTFPGGLQQGKYSKRYDGLNPDIEYAFWACEVDKDYKIVGKVEYVLVTGGEVQGGDQNEPAFDENGALKGKFTVNSDGDQIVFSRGNLQYVGTWQFAVNQWDYFGEYQSGNHRDVFGWGSGDNPNITETTIKSYEPEYDSFYEWGRNPITNGGNKANLWRTLESKEWEFIISMRDKAFSLFGLGSVEGIDGMIILPDNWDLPIGASFTPFFTKDMAEKSYYTVVWFIYSDLEGSSYTEQLEVRYYGIPDGDDGYTHNTYTKEQWSVMEKAGAVFLPGPGGVGYGRYWSATDHADQAYILEFNQCRITKYRYETKSSNCAVRLVQDVQ